MKPFLVALILLPNLALAAGEIRLLPAVQRLNAMSARLAPVDVRVDLSGLPVNERQALAHLVRAARITDALFLRQVWAGNEALLLKLMADTTLLGQARLNAFLIDKGPWSRLDLDASFIPGIG